jgi:hypothetical protein
MKKIIALAVAGAFVAPVYAADVTLSGDLEFRYVSEDGEGMYNTYDDGDITVTATEELANGMTVTAKIGVEDAETSSGGGDVELHVAGAFGTLMMGEVDAAVNQIDELGSPAKFGGGAGNPGLDDTAAENATNTVSWTLPTLVEGLSVTASNGTTGAGTDGTDDEETTTSVAVTYSVAGFTLAAGTLDRDNETYDPSYVGFSYASGPLTIGMDSTSEDGVATTDTQSIGATYDLGNGTSVYAESNETEVSGSTTEETFVGVSYTVGGGLSLAVESKNSDTSGADSTTLGVFYAF